MPDPVDRRRRQYGRTDRSNSGCPNSRSGFLNSATDHASCDTNPVLDVPSKSSPCRGLWREHRNIAALIAAERRESANVLEELTPTQRDAPSLCAGRRVREVVAHMSMGFRYPTAHRDRPGHHRRPGPEPAVPSTAAPHGRLQGEEAHRFVTA
ncbi:maleylpyruvate isomerase N-terminal domain-containing protein [Streptomyces murinus]